MLVIVYGTIGEIGKVCRSYLQERGFERVEKFNYATAPQLTPSIGTRPYVSKKKFYTHTDPLFRYEVGNIQVGCNREQIARAVSGEMDGFITVASEDISFLEKIMREQEVKRIYADQVHLVYVYIDDRTLNAMVEAMPTMSDEEKAYRLRLGKQIKQQYLQNQDLFDDVLIYGGAESSFGFDGLKQQMKSILQRYRPEEERPVEYGDVVIPCAPEDKNVYDDLREWLLVNGVSVFDNRQLTGNVIQQAMMMEDAIRHAKMVIPICSPAFSRAEGIHRALVVRLIEAYGKQAVAVEWGAKAGAARLWCSEPCKIRQTTYAEDVEYAAGVAANILQMEEELKQHYLQVESYLKLGMYESAWRIQEDHFRLSLDMGNTETILSSAEKLTAILIHLRNYNQAMQTIEMTMGYVGCVPSLMHYLAVCGRDLQMGEEQMTAWLTEEIGYMTAETQAKILAAYHEWYPQAMAALLAAETAPTPRTTHALPSSGLASAVDEREIAEYGKKALELFEAVVAATPYLSRQDLIDGYQRILDYCQEVGLRGEVPTMCIQRMDALRSKTGAATAENPTAETTALKVFLGKAFPQSGYYDAFISYKSENEAQARDVYDFLSSQGKVVFFAPKTLNAIGNSDYTAEIMKAIEHSVHMVLVGDNPAYFSTDWVKREWTTFLKKGKGQLVLVLKDGSTKKNVDGLPQELAEKQILSLSAYKANILTFLSKVE